MGTPSYMEPGQFFEARGVDARADVYSVAAMLYELLSGKLPLDAESYAHLIVKVRTEQPVPLQQVAPQLPVPLAQVVTVGLAKEPGQRWQSTREFGEALRSALALPAPGSTPAFLPNATPAPVATPMPLANVGGLDKTSPPQPSRPGTPAPPASGGWVVPTSGSSNTGIPVPASLPVQQVSAPGQAGAIAPPPPAPSQPSAPGKKSNAWKWVVGVLAVIMLGGGCCTCLAVGTALDQKNKAEVTPTPAPRPGPRPHQPSVEPEPEPEPDPDAELQPDPEPDPG